MSKGGKSVETTIPYWLEDAAKRNLNQADRISRIGPVPMSYGPTAAAFSPMTNSSFLNTANTANSFGLNAPTGTAVTGGMPAPTNYGGVSGYSAKPVFDAITGEFTDDRPAQASYIDSFFVNPFTGTTGINSGNVSDIGYANTVPVGVDGQPVIGGGSGGSGGSDPYNGGDSVSDFLDPNGRFGLEEHMARQKMNYASAAQANPGNLIFNYGQDADGGVYAVGYGPDTISSAEALKMGLTTKEKNPFDMSFGDHASQIGSDVKNIATTAAKDFAKFSPVSQIVNSISNNNDNNNNNNNNDPAYLSNPSFAAGGNLQAETNLINSSMSDDDFFDALESDNTVGAAVSGNKDNCVIATHAISTGAYNYKTLRQAEVWCLRKLHNRWWGETIRRGYRHLGRSKIAQGKAHEHYEEFQRYIDFATGKKRTLKGALTFIFRSVQFFCVGIFKRSN